MHDTGNTFDPLFVSPNLYGVSGLNFAVVDDQVTPQAAMAERAMSALPGTKPQFEYINNKKKIPVEKAILA